MPPRLIINADDFGLTPGINRAIIELHQAGVVTSATLMANGPAFEDAVALALANPTLGVGCHLVFVDGVPVAYPESIPTLLGGDGKTFRPSLLEFAQAALRGSILPADLARETQAQIQKLQRTGIDVTHIDTHKHTHIFPSIARAVLPIAQRCGVRAFRYPFEPWWSINLSRTHAPSPRLLQVPLLRLFEPAFRKLIDLHADETTTSGTLGIAATGTLDCVTLRNLLSGLTERDDGILYELCCHPGYIDAELRALPTRLRRSREVERDALLSVVPEILQHPQAPELIHYGCLGITGLQRQTSHFTRTTGYEKVL